ncbi:double-strand break repair helicase AddA [Halocynthiibacter sp. C4]|uniref:double-strand break repair helicase AddA n=1 Tax=Halocynthiibacter sp. C4 TaxID=2992758 RepID=UPI00237A874B|nr:double-strand break repair helicase AddA [Halocynthiibacter sp. C4]MDE0591020.1 double-strand break repair helicase AddA [Halocynthiibacter sp. C4]
MIKRDLATERQVQAANPFASTWLSANAGSGKTRVLTDRVARLLLANVKPQNILCLTYTKAAASEMQNRLFARLGKWAMLETDLLRNDLIALGVEGSISDEDIRNARRLFARAIEAPGGLKIQTIHSFCASILRRFPLEAGVSPQFSEMDERSARLLHEEVIDEMILGGERALIDDVAAVYTAEEFGKFTAEIAKFRNELSTPVDAAEIWQSLGLSAGYSQTDLENDTFLPTDGALLKEILPFFLQGSSTDAKNGEKLRLVDFDALSAKDLLILEDVFLFKDGAKAAQAKIGSVPTKATQKLISDKMDALEKLMARVENARSSRLRLHTAERTLVLRRFAAEFLPRFEQKKQVRGWLDFDDQIYKARDLLTNPLVAQWVLYRLDGGIDHILVDESQDTSPAQWQVIENLAQELTSGEGAKEDAHRSIFVVGDKKQSIYSFQGADPAEFDRMNAHFAERLKEAGAGLVNLQLEHSFRSAEPVLSLVDFTFKAIGGNGVGGETTHLAFKSAMPGRVDHWPLEEPEQDNDERNWYDPVDKVSQSHHNVRLARKIAGEIKRMIEEKVTIPDEIGHSGTFEQRPVTPGDFLILVQGRRGLFPEIIRECKAQKLDIAGADRLKIGGELAVKDIVALLSFLATPEDSLSLASVLKSPLFGWSEQQLFDLAHRRQEKYLWAAMRNRAEEFPEEMRVLEDLRRASDFLRPYEIIERALTVFGGRKKLIARLGEEAEDGIDALLDQALNFEQMEIPSLTGFLSWLQTDEVEIKRQVDSASDQIRVMTVHGAKGLEAPIVILPDTAAKKNSVDAQLVKMADNSVIWKPGAKQMPPEVSNQVDTMKDLQQQEKMRLLYVAMTRAEKWLIVCGAGKLDKDGNAWHGIVEKGMRAAGAVEFDTPSGQGLRLQNEDWSALPIAKLDKVNTAKDTALPAWATQTAPVPVKPAKPLSPSDLGGEKALPGVGGLSEEEAMQRGTDIHLLLEHLPTVSEEDRPERARQLLGRDDPELQEEASNCLANPKLADVFSPSALAEVNVVAKLDELSGRAIEGQIDRLIVTDSEVLIVDFKTNAIVPKSAEQVPEGLLRQMGAYVAAISQIYPDKPISCAILWTKSAELMALPNATVTAALSRVNMP